MTDTKSFNCPNCGSALTPDGDLKEVKCPFCGSTVIVPEQLRDQDEDDDDELERTPALVGGSQHVPWLIRTGTDATFRVDTVIVYDKMIDMKPIVNLALKGKTADGKLLDLYTEVVIPRSAIPRKGDMVKIKYNPARSLDFAVQLGGQFYYQYNNLYGYNPSTN